MLVLFVAEVLEVPPAVFANTEVLDVAVAPSVLVEPAVLVALVVPAELVVLDELVVLFAEVPVVPVKS